MAITTTVQCLQFLQGIEETSREIRRQLAAATLTPALFDTVLGDVQTIVEDVESVEAYVSEQASLGERCDVCGRILPNHDDEIHAMADAQVDAERGQQGEE